MRPPPVDRVWIVMDAGGRWGELLWLLLGALGLLAGVWTIIYLVVVR